MNEPANLTGTTVNPLQRPLELLRRGIRKYVSWEGALVLGLFVVSWFWVGLALDYGSFKLAAFDWVQELPRWFRGGLLALFSAVIAILISGKLIRRLTAELRPDALALVLEKQFSDVLGDRLITAVELNDMQRAQNQGYSQAMIAETVRELGERLHTLPIGRAFAWDRLRRLGWWLAALVVAPLLLFGLTYSIWRKTNPWDDYLPRFRETATLWVRRNLLLQDVIWPRKAYLELLDFPASGEWRIGRDAPSPRLRFRARRWIIADTNALDGWRPMDWNDLRPGLVGMPVPELPSGWFATNPSDQHVDAIRVAAAISAPQHLPVPAEVVRPNGRDSWTLDGIEQVLEDETTRKRLEAQNPELMKSMEQVLATLTEQAMQHNRSTGFRRLEVPDRIEVRYWGGQTFNRMELLRGPGWEYAGALTDLKESVKFWARGADYYTPTRSIVLVPPPALQYMAKVEHRPAYLYHRPPLGDAAALKGLKQRIESVVSLNGPTSRIALPAGSDLELSGQLDKELQAATLRLRPQRGETNPAKDIALTLTDDRAGFHHRLANLVAPLDFDLEFTDLDGVKSTRHVVVEPATDPAPFVNVAIDGIRLTRQGHYLVTPIAMIPIEGKINDGPPGTLGGLDRIDYEITLARLEPSSIAAAQAGFIVGAVTPAIGGGGDSQLANALAAALTGQLVSATAPTTLTRSLPFVSFQQVMQDRAARDIDLAELQRRLKDRPPSGPQMRDFTVQPQFERLDLRERLPDLKVKDELDVQPRYRMKLTVAAADNNIETGPGISFNKEPPFNVLIVSETELLIEIARDEETQHVKTEDAIARLKEVRLKLDKVGEELPTTGQPSALVQRALEMTEAAGRSRDLMQEVLSDYSRILRELRLNRVSSKFIEKIGGEICLPLESCLKGEFAQAEEALEEYRKQLEANRRPEAALEGSVRQRLDRLIARLSDIMAAMGEITTLNKLITTLREIEKGQEQIIAARLKELQRLQREKLIRDLNRLKGTEGP